MKQSAVLLFLILTSLIAEAENKWELRKNSEGIKIYTRSVEGSGIKELKAEFEATGNIRQLAKILLDIPGQKDWVYSTKASTVVKVIAENELIYYSEKSMPWPVSNRDVVTRVKVLQDTAKGTLTLTAFSENNIIPVKKNIVRVPSSQVTWKVSTTGSNRLKIEYYAKADPGGTLPAWVTNMFLTKGPYETFVKLRAILQNASH
ncbi:MAG: hypothetical protein JST82_12275 [Bacteroidetes bacterium]|nr:hypothetical protein [Bacteroidota bacterium]